MTELSDDQKRLVQSSFHAMLGVLVVGLDNVSALSGAIS